MMVAVPALTACASPLTGSIVTTPVVSDVQAKTDPAGSGVVELSLFSCSALN